MFVVLAAVGVLGFMFTQIIIDDDITLLLTAAVSNYSGLLQVILGIDCVYLIGIICKILYNWLMATVLQSCLKHIRGDMFYHMQNFLVTYF